MTQPHTATATSPRALAQADAATAADAVQMIAEVAALLDRFESKPSLWRRITRRPNPLALPLARATALLKIQEEAGEAAQAYLSYLDLNPRKSPGPMFHVLTELADTAISAMVSMARIDNDAWAPLLAGRLRECHGRLSVVDRGRSARRSRHRFARAEPAR